MPMTSVYGVTDEEVRLFIGENEIVRTWLRKYLSVNRFGMAHVLCRFLKWLRIVKGVEFSPKELLNSHIGLRSHSNIADRQKHLHWVLEHTRDNHFQG